jgi:hypothetical protein
METVSHLAISRRQGFVNDETHKLLYDRADKLARMLSGLRQTLRSNSGP